jgi:hypothetical protein
MADAVAWLLLVYRIPSEPTRLRAGVWRRLKGLGAIYVQNSVAAMPMSPSAERALRSLRNEIGEMGGSAQLLRADAMAGEADLVRAFNEARDEEYDEVLVRCTDFLAEIERETREEHFTYAELEENDEDLVKLKGWLAKINVRDQLGATKRAAAERALDRCEAALGEFAERVYALQDASA